MKGRYAPSPTGPLHLGNARTALLAWLAARAAGSAFVMRIEDLDRPRIAPGADKRLLDELLWLGIDWDEGPDLGGPAGSYRQSERTAFYDDAITRLLADGRAYLCSCSRADVARAVTAPHAADEEGPRYPGTCRGNDARTVTERAAAQGRRPSVRFDGRGERVAFVDGVHGAVGGDGQVQVGQGDVGEVDDFVLRRADGVASYQLAVVVDDAAMAIQQVVRGDDLLPSTPRQIALGRALGLGIPAFAHVPLVLSPGGERLAKRTRPASLASLRAGGVSPEAVVGALGASAGLCPPGARLPAAALIAGFDLDRLPRAPVVIEDGALT
ncbi:MAG: glutamyl-tRNA synthetase [Myxococcales bacterium]|jgi:glutamyl-tRNA synthetase|nr:glutamyl-tRNA synthetase [Myxococcales bacterium]